MHRYDSKATTIIQSRLSLLTKEFKEVSFNTDSTARGTTVYLILPIVL